MSEFARLENLLSKFSKLNDVDGYRSMSFKNDIKTMYTFLRDDKSYSLVQHSNKLSDVKLSANAFDFLYHGIVTYQIPSEILLVSASSLVLLIPLLSSSPEIYFWILLSSVEVICNNPTPTSIISQSEVELYVSSFSRKVNISQYEEDNMDSTDYIRKIELSQYDNSVNINRTKHLSLFNFSKIQPVFKTYLFLHSILSTKPCWLFKKINYPLDINIKLNTADPGMFDNLFFLIWPLISELCLTSSSHSCQSLQVLYIWIKIAKDYLISHFNKFQRSDIMCYKLNDGKGVIKDLHSMNKEFPMCEDHENHERTCFLCHESSIAGWFSLKLGSQGEILVVLSLNWENKSKGSSTIVQQCLSEMLALHEYFLPGHAKSSMKDIIELVFNSSLWHSKSTYLQLQLSLKHLGIDEIMKICPEIPQHMSTCLKSNQLLPAVTNLYQSFITLLSEKKWLELFANEHSKISNCTDKVLRHNYFTMWLPITISRFPQLLQELLSLCGFCLSGWQTKLTILKIAKANSLVELNYVMSCDKKRCKSIAPTTALNLEYQYQIKKIISASLIHSDETIRADALNFICSSKKASEPVTQDEIRLVKVFIEENMNTDSTNFRQSVVKSFGTLMHRLRDAAIAEIKKQSLIAKALDNSTNSNYEKKDILVTADVASTYCGSHSKISSNICAKSKCSPQLNFVLDCFSWFIYSLNDHFNAFGNYSRTYTSLKLYSELLSTLYNLESGTIEPQFEKVVQLINQATTIDHTNKIQTNCILPAITNLMIPSTLNSLITLIAHEMIDIKDLSAKILNFVIKNSNINRISYNIWIKQALNMCESPKFGTAESGAILISVLINSEMDHLTNKSQGIVNPECNVNENIYYLDSKGIINYLIDKIEMDFKKVFENILHCSSNTPIYGSILALTKCLTDNDSVAVELDNDYITEKIAVLCTLYQTIIEEILSRLARKSAGGSKISPSFLEMGESISYMIRECKEKESLNQLSISDSFLTETGCKCQCSEEALSDDHQLVLSFCWQLLKVCCWSCYKLTCKWSYLINDRIFDLIVSSIVIRVLTGTRHKGAMEAAFAALQEISSVVYKANLCTKEKILEKQLNKIIWSLENQAETSVTRRSAGLSMVFTAICQVIPHRNVPSVTVGVVKQLLAISLIKVSNEITHTDVSPAMGLHILYSMISCATLTASTLPFLSDICVACLESFNVESWAVRNAAFLLYGAVVSRLIGQKNVKEDSSSFNCITATEFCSRHSALCSVILKKLEQCRLTKNGGLLPGLGSNDNISVENNVLRNHTPHQSAISDIPKDPAVFEKLDSSLVPLLSLLSRLNPGTETQLKDDITDVISKLVENVSSFLSYPVFTVRRLAAAALYSLTTVSRTDELRKLVVQQGLRNIWINSNLVNGCLITLNLLRQRQEFFSLDDKDLRHLIKVILSNVYLVVENKCQVLDLSVILGLDNDMNFSLPRSRHMPGSSQLVKIVIKNKLKDKKFFNPSTIVALLKLNNQDICEEIQSYLKSNFDLIDQEVAFTLQKECWKLILYAKTNFQLKYVFQILNLLLSNTELAFDDCVTCFFKLQQILSGEHGHILSLKCLIIVSQLIKHYEYFDGNCQLTFHNILELWTKTVEKFSSCSSTEECRSYAVDALNNSILFIYNKTFCNKLRIFKSLLELVQDENLLIRFKAAQTVQHFTMAHQMKYSCYDSQSEDKYLTNFNPTDKVSFINEQKESDSINSQPVNESLINDLKNKDHCHLRHSPKSFIDEGGFYFVGDTIRVAKPSDDSEDNFQIKFVSFFNSFMESEYRILDINFAIQPHVALKLLINYLVAEALRCEDECLLKLLGNNFKLRDNRCRCKSASSKLFESSDNLYKEQYIVCQFIVNSLKVALNITKYMFTENWKLLCLQYVNFAKKNIVKKSESEITAVDLLTNRRKIEEAKINNSHSQFLTILAEIK